MASLQSMLTTTAVLPEKDAQEVASVPLGHRGLSSLTLDRGLKLAVDANCCHAALAGANVFRQVQGSRRQPRVSQD